MKSNVYSKFWGAGVTTAQCQHPPWKNNCLKFSFQVLLCHKRYIISVMRFLSCWWFAIAVLHTFIIVCFIKFWLGTKALLYHHRIPYFVPTWLGRGWDTAHWCRRTRRTTRRSFNTARLAFAAPLQHRGESFGSTCAACTRLWWRPGRGPWSTLALTSFLLLLMGGWRIVEGGGACLMRTTYHTKHATFDALESVMCDVIKIRL